MSILSGCQHHLSFCLMSLLKGSFSAVIRDPASCSTSNPPGGPNLSHSHVSGYNPSPSFFPASSSPEAEWQGKSQSSNTPLGALGDSRQEVQDLKEQLEALRCQVGCSLRHGIKKKNPISDVMRAELMSTHCCQGKICLMLKLELDGKLHHQVASLRCSEMCSQCNK